jgi:flagellum-specific ATP synthase
MAEIETPSGFSEAEVVGFRDGRLQLIPLAGMRGIGAGSRVWPFASSASVQAGEALLGRVVDGMGQVIDGGPPLPRGFEVPLYRDPIPPLDRPVLEAPLDVGIRTINALATCARGQRLGLFAGSGIGKSILLGMMIRGTNADVRVLGLIGERGREVREFVDREIGPARKDTVVVAVPSDASPLLRMRGAYVATAIAEFFRDEGSDVLLVMDSITRYALAGREVGLARGEPATTKGYTPSVFADLPMLLERAGRLERGSITGIYTVLVEGADFEDPIVDALRAILDGHVVLSRELAERGHYPPIDPLTSVSRAMPFITDLNHRELATRLRRLLSGYRDAEDLIQVGAYSRGSDPVVDEAIDRKPAIDRFLQQDITEVADLSGSVAALAALLGEGQA